MKSSTELDQKKPFVDHLSELRYRLLFLAISYAATAILIFIFWDMLFAYLIKYVPHVEEKSLWGTNFDISSTSRYAMPLKISFIVCLPLIIYQFWRFLYPGLLETERKTTFYFLLISIIMFYLGILFIPVGILEVYSTLPLFQTEQNAALSLYIHNIPLIFCGLSSSSIVIPLFLTYRGVATVERMKSFRIYIIVIVIGFPLLFADHSLSILCGGVFWAIFELGLLLSIALHKYKNRSW